MIRTVTVDVDIDMSDFETRDLEAELQSRGKSVNPLPNEPISDLNEIYYALKFGMNERALELVRKHLCDQLGVIL